MVLKSIVPDVRILVYLEIVSDIHYTDCARLGL